MTTNCTCTRLTGSQLWIVAGLLNAKLSSWRLDHERHTATLNDPNSCPIDQYQARCSLVSLTEAIATGTAALNTLRSGRWGMGGDHV